MATYGCYTNQQLQAVNWMATGAAIGDMAQLGKGCLYGALDSQANTFYPEVFCDDTVADGASTSALMSNNFYDEYAEGLYCPTYAGFFGVMGATAAIVFSSLGAAYGTAKSGTGIANMAIMHPELIMKSIIPVVMAGIIAIYGLVVSVLIGNGMSAPNSYSLFRGFIDLGAGLAVGISGLAAGYAIGIVGDCGVRGTGQQPKLFVGMILILIFAEVLGLYGLIVALILTTNGAKTLDCHAETYNPCCPSGYFGIFTQAAGAGAITACGKMEAGAAA